MNSPPQAFRIYTMEGSRLAARFEPLYAEELLVFGRLTIIGHSVVAGKPIKVVGIGALPEPGGRVVVGDQPIEILRIEGETIPIFPSETINEVVEIPIPAGFLPE